MDKFDEDKSDSDIENAPSIHYKQYVSVNEKENSDDEQRLSTSSSITNLQDDDNPDLLKFNYYSAVTLIVSSTLSLLISYSYNDYLFYFLYYHEKIKILSLLSQFLSNFSIIGFNLFFIYILEKKKSSLVKKTIINLLKNSFYILNFSLSLLFLIRAFLSDFIYLIISFIIICICLIIVSRFYRPIKIKRELDIYTLISISIYFSVLTVILSFLFMNNLTELFLLYYNKSSFNNSQIKLNIINGIEFGMSFILLVYYKDIIIMITNIFLVFIPQLIRQLEVENKNYWDLLLLIIICLIVTIWMLKKEGRKLFNISSKKSEKEMIKLKEVDTTTL
jgi:hypothetical protein